MRPDLDSLDAYDFALPEDRIAHTPSPHRDASRLLVCARDKTRHLTPFSSLDQHLRPGDLLVFNDTRVLPCRLIARRPTGGRVEIFALPPADPTPWTLPPPPEGLPLRALVRASRPVRPGQEARVEGADASITFGPRHGAEAEITYRGDLPLADALQRAGHRPRPPDSLKRRRDLGLPEEAPEDAERYQTVYASQPGAVAAPTAGLHFTPDLLQRLQAAGVELGFVTLHVGMGTFKPLDEDTPLGQQRLHTERYHISPRLAEQLQQANDRGARVIAVGTTSLRALEDQGRRHGQRRVTPGAFDADLFIRPGFRFHLTDALITNLHLPRSSLMVLVSTFAGYELVREAYQDAIARQLRFFSYGDAMLLERAL